MNLIFLAGLTPFGYAFIGVLLLSFLLAYFWLKSNGKEYKLGCASIGIAGFIIWFVLMFPTFITFSVIENGNTAAKIGTGIFWFLVLLLINPIRLPFPVLTLLFQDHKKLFFLS